MIFVVLGKGLVIFLFDDFSQTQGKFLLYEGKLTNCIYILNDLGVLRLVSSDKSHFLNASGLIHGFHLPC